MPKRPQHELMRLVTSDLQRGTSPRTHRISFLPGQAELFHLQCIHPRPEEGFCLDADAAREDPADFLERCFKGSSRMRNGLIETWWEGDRPGLCWHFAVPFS